MGASIGAVRMGADKGAVFRRGLCVGIGDLGVCLRGISGLWLHEVPAFAGTAACEGSSFDFAQDERSIQT
ncbi:hypothetical protein HOC_12767 [Hyphomonas oceanitis SCH89]|uniref:Uncharacterized protein n=1 Tax=Hyphomonas oceanitis SCH89 TaxID=1280953 RepID=A0A059G5F1_9PROT|nr:hypothetical protein HOC_12767 [Hyphomonas oceanitis SCH89]